MELGTFFCRYLCFEEEWKNFYEARWPAFSWSENFESKSLARSAKGNEVECESANDWQQMYWEAHLQKYEHQIVYLLVVTTILFGFSSPVILKFHFFLRNSCLDIAAEFALFPSFHGQIGEIQVPGKRFMLIDVSYHPLHHLLANQVMAARPAPSLCITVLG